MESINSIIDRYIKIAKEKQYLEQSLKSTDDIVLQKLNMNKQRDINRMNKILQFICNEFDNRLSNMNLEEVERIKKILSAKIYNLKNKADNLNTNINEGSTNHLRYSEDKYHDMESYLNMASNKYIQLDDLYFDISCYDSFLNIINIHTSRKVNQKAI